jgi:hypothetical protein
MSWIDNLQEVFGFKVKSAEAPEQQTFTLQRDEMADGVALEIGSGGTTHLSYENTIVPAEERDLVVSYRSMAQSSDVDLAISEIRNELFIYDVPGERAFDLAFTEEDGAPSKKIQDKVIETFRDLYQVIDFTNRGPEYFDEWYINGKLYLQKLVDPEDKKAGINGVVIVDPLKIRKVRIIPRPDAEGTIDKSKIRQLYVFNNTVNTQSTSPTWSPIQDIQFGTNVNGMQIEADSIAYIDSGNFDYTLGRYVGYLKKAILPYNNLRMMEDAMLIFRVVRAPMRRVFYIDVGALQKNKADEYMKSMMNRFKVKMVYDTKTGAMSDRRNIQSMMEDYWLPRRDSGRATEVQNLEGQDSNSILDEVNYYRRKLFEALNVPISRFSDNPAPFVFGRGVEIQRDEYRFKKFLDKLRGKFMQIWDDLLRTQLILKGVCTDEEWPNIRRYMFWNFSEDNAFVELKESELLNSRIALVAAMDPFVGKYYSKEYVRRKVLRQDEDEMAAEDETMDKEAEDAPPLEQQQFDHQGRMNDLEFDHTQKMNDITQDTAQSGAKAAAVNVDVAKVGVDMAKAKVQNVKKHGNTGSKQQPKPKSAS